jgi:3-hydroxyacyl-[acyl-carrier-protein] dehydratase
MSDIQGTFFFDPEDRIYDDHFPGHPVVPGSMIVHAFLLAAEKARRGWRPCVVENFRFKRFISPGEYAYRIELAGDDELKCTLYDKRSVAAAGTLRG